MRVLPAILVSIWGAFIASPSPGLALEQDVQVVTTGIGAISPASVDILESALTLAKKEQAAALIVELDTPGGMLESTRVMVREILNAPVPVIVWVGPKGARAASAGAFITMAAHVAVMAHATNIGAAHPVAIGAPGGSGGKNESDAGIAREKALKDTLAMAEAIANARGRNVEFARSFVLASESITAEEAANAKVVDLLADSLDEVLAATSGRTVVLENKGSVTLQLKGARIIRHEKSLRHRILEIVADPNLFYLLFLAGIIGLGFELTHPGAIFPGVAGAICMLLSLTAMSVLPVNYGALALLLAGIGMMVAEIFVPSFGSLGIGGLIAFVLGSSLLFDPSTGLAVSLWTILPGAVAIAAFLAFIGLVSMKAIQSKVTSGQEGMIGKTAEVIRDFQGNRGSVRVSGEIWTAELPPEDSAKAGESLRVVRVEGLVLFVKK